MAPSGKAYNVDWIISTNSNVHVANNRDWFTSFTPFETYSGSTYFDSRVEVAGIGTVQLNVRLYKRSRARQANSRIITLHNVLYAPSAICNIFGQSSSSDYGFRHDFSQKSGTVIDQDGNRAGLIEMFRLPRLRLHGRRGGWSVLDAGAMYMINSWWPDTERVRWNAYQVTQQSVPVIPYDGDAPYSAEEKAWLKDFGGEYKFLQRFGLSIYNEEDRAEGRAIVRSWIAEDGDRPEGNGSRVQNVSMGGRAHENDDDDDDKLDDEDGDGDEFDTDKFLQEMREDPLSHLADYNFSPAELKWIQKHYQYSSRFMLSYGLKPFEQEDCAEAKAIVRDIMKTDGII